MIWPISINVADDELLTVDSIDVVKMNIAENEWNEIYISSDLWISSFCRVSSAHHVCNNICNVLNI